MKKRLLCMLLCAVMLVGIVPAGTLTVFAQDEPAITGKAASFDDGGLAATGAYIGGSASDDPDAYKTNDEIAGELLAETGGDTVLVGVGAEYDPAATGDDSYAGDYPDPENPYIANDFGGLRKVFVKDRENLAPEDKICYIKLGRDIFYEAESYTIHNGNTVTHVEQSIALTTHFTEVHLDLAGYTLCVETGFEPYFIGSGYGYIYISDSGRYDPVSNKWVQGSLIYRNNNSGRKNAWTRVLHGGVVVESGYIYNSSVPVDGVVDYVYYGSGLEMYGGTFVGPAPIRIACSSSNKIDGGTLMVTGDTGVRIGMDEFTINYLTHYKQHWEYYMKYVSFPKIKDLVIINSSKNETIDAFNISFPKEDRDGYGELVIYPHWTQTADMLFETIVDGGTGYTGCYIDGNLPESSYDGLTYDEDRPDIRGHAFKNKYEITPIEIVQDIEINMPRPKSGQPLPYDVYVPNNAAYSVKYNYSYSYINGVSWACDGSPMMVADTPRFISGHKYTILILIILKYTTGSVFTETQYINATVNGARATVQRLAENEVCVKYEFDYTTQGVISSLDVTIPEPSTGKVISYSTSIPSDVNYAVEDYADEVYDCGVAWEYNGADVDPRKVVRFLPGGAYTVWVSLILTDPDWYSFDSVSNMTATLNGHEASVVRFSADNYAVKYTFYMPDRIDNIPVTIATPKAGEYIKNYYLAEAPEGMGYQVTDYNSEYYKHGVAWAAKGNRVIEPDSDERFRLGDQYTVHIDVDIIDTRTNYFEDESSINATVNGRKAQARSYDEYTFSLAYTFTVTSSGKAIYDLVFTIPEPVAGDLITYEAWVPEGAGYKIGEGYSHLEYINGLEWRCENNVLKKDQQYYFEPGKTYKLRIDVDKVSMVFYYGYALEVKGYVNGNKASVFWDSSSGNVDFIDYTFTVPAAAALGDVDGDGIVTIIDATAIQLMLSDESVKGYNATAADADEDGELSILDVTLIQRYLASYTVAHPIGQYITE